MIGGKAILPLLLTALVVVSSGCISMDATAFAKTIPMVQEFLNEYPNADISITHYSETESADILEYIKEDCGKLTVEAKEYYFVNITDPSSGLIVRAWIDWENQIVECVYKEGILVDPEDCVSQHRSKCYGDHVFWFDSCNNREGKREYCPLGCSNGECIPGRICETEKSYTEKPECTCPDGYEMMVLYPRCADSITGAITGMPFAVTETTASKAVTTDKTGVMISSEFTTEFKYRCPDSKPVYRCIKREQCRSRAQSMCYRGHVFWFDSCGHVQEKKEYCKNGCDKGFCKEMNDCYLEGGYCENSNIGTDVCKEVDNYVISDVDCGAGRHCCLRETTTCTDTDGGLDYYVKGTTCFGGGSTETHCKVDSCIHPDCVGCADQIIEYYCSDDEITHKYADCPGVCEDGACVAEECRDENYECYIGDMPCCAGLKEVPLALEESGTGICIAANCGSICRPCGNGICDDNENWCNCPEDCEEECTDTCSPDGNLRCSPIYDTIDICTEYGGCLNWIVKEHCEPNEKCENGKCVFDRECITYQAIDDSTQDINSEYPGYLDIMRTGIKELESDQYKFWVALREEINPSDHSFTYKWIIDSDMNSSTGELNYYNDEYIGNEYNIKINYYADGGIWFLSIDTLGDIINVSIDPALNEFNTTDYNVAYIIVNKSQLMDIEEFDWAFAVETSMKPNDITDVVRFSSENTENC